MIPVIITVVGGNIGLWIYNSVKTNPLEEKVTIMNKVCPLQIDDDTMLDSITLNNKNEIHQHYSFINTLEADVDSLFFVNSMKESIIDHYQENIPKEELQFLQKHKATLVSRYFDKNKINVANLKLKSNDYIKK